MKTKLFVLAGLLTMGASAFAQEQPNSAQYHALHNPNSPYSTDASQQPAAPTVRWADRWGAFAMDGNGHSGAVVGLTSKRAAKKAAIADCKNRGGGQCEVRMAYYNQCVAVAASTKTNSVVRAPYEEEAKESALRRCEANNKPGACWIYYSGCSLPVQVQ